MNDVCVVHVSGLVGKSRVDGCRLPSKGFNISTNSRTPRIASREYLRISAGKPQKGRNKNP
jgi:hypothetical protein